MNLRNSAAARRVTLCCFAVLIALTAAAAPKMQVDELVEGVIKSQRAMDDFHFSSATKFDDLLVRPKTALPDDAVFRRFQDLTDDDMLRTAFRTVEDPWQRRLIVEVSESATDILRRNGDDGATILRNMDKEGLVFHRMLPESRHTIEAMFKDSADAKTLLRKTGNHGAEFYEKYVRPHKKKWVAAGLFTAFFANPEYWINETGQLTEHAITKLAELGVSVAEGAARGTARGFFTTPWGIALFCVLLLVVVNWLGAQVGLAKGWLLRLPVRLVRKLVSRNQEAGVGSGEPDIHSESQESSGDSLSKACAVPEQDDPDAGSEKEVESSR